ncbi:MAG: hypothetical protein RR247_02720 [Clostridia bacterium]
MNTTLKERKQKALEIMKELGIFKPYIDGFNKENNVCFYENFGGFCVWQEPEIEAKMKEIEKEYNSTCYAITHEFTKFGECYDFLLITDYKEEWVALVSECETYHTAFAYVWNKDDGTCSELGDILISSFGGGIRRIG